MELGTFPSRIISNPQEREERWTRTKVWRLDYLNSGIVNSDQFTRSTDLKHALHVNNKGNPDLELRIFVVEDLSRDVIESLGSYYDIDPSFFRSHLADYVGYNVRDPWRDPSNLLKDSRSLDWFQIRFPTVRYFDTINSFYHCSGETQKWNVLRRADNDLNKAIWDKEGAVVAVLRSKATFWLKKAEPECSAATGKFMFTNMRS